MQKQIKIIDADGKALASAHIIPDNGTPTITDSNGMAMVKVNSIKDWVEISHVSGENVVMPFFDLPEVLQLGVNILPEVVIEDKKKINPLWIILPTIAAITLIIKANQPQKVTL